MAKKIFDANFEYCDLLGNYCQEVLFFRCVEICLGIRGLMVCATSQVRHFTCQLLLRFGGRNFSTADPQEPQEPQGP